MTPAARPLPAAGSGPQATAVAVTGHVRLAPEVRGPVGEALRRFLAAFPADGLTGLSCLAEGADALFADAVLAAGGRLVAVLPSADYRERMVAPHYAAEFDRLRAAASEVRTLPYRRASAHAYAAAGRLLLGRADLLVAVWDGRPGRPGGTADTVAAARAAGLPVTVLRPGPGRP
ncbi:MULTISPECIES: hypothetical protein [Streptomyces]|uniref:hypothetical protein n=1 Tax=Streptomyces TaxID=1883 RepID=UPI000F73B623|nr:hypothetical protein [Streptomyces sp. WAC05292]RSS81352.1 hypothetical protein EF903_28920 [Streptomyces sp. WAC05292]